ncbi:hypothetical protein [Mucilaginibacter segetis]|uniref:Lipocalin-like domain-containing protein n=1 Tax=Mucilaginibacter segetis TaxID=2793071 RepID=A0A934PQS2_9SPHI|nr:hypothetical protein [Mucilaginibacter segetis]MBK0377730.1 hypothetical protein [Mucilaginibacter segetis]
MKTKIKLKKMILTLILLAAGSIVSYAQCGKNVLFSSVETIYLDADGDIQRTVDEPASIEYGKTNIKLTHGTENEEMNGIIKSNTCNWTVPFKEGKSVITATFSNNNGDEKDATITIEGKNGKVTLTFEMEDMSGRKIQVAADKFIEKT